MVNTLDIPACQTLQLSPGEALPAALLESTVPVKLPSYIAHWQAVQLGIESSEALSKQILTYYTGEALGLFYGKPEIQGRFFYNDTLTGFNFDKVAATLDTVLQRLHQEANVAEPHSLFIGGTHLQHYLPGFEHHNPPVPVPHAQPRNGLWIGNQTRVAIHQDLPLNIACCVAGSRRFTLFPPNQTANLYIGPLDVTPSGQPVSLVDLHNIDYQKYPKFKTALQHAQVAELEPGDALFIPSMWWHEVSALAPFNVLVNYWWRTTPDYADAPINALNHALLAIAHLPDNEKQIWQDMFNHSVFESTPASHAHIPEYARGPLGEMNDAMARRLRSVLLQSLNR